MARAHPYSGRSPLVAATVAFAAALVLVQGGCRLAPREQVDECHRLSQALRTENAHLRDQVLALRSVNEDYSERAVDDGRRLAQLEDANRQLMASVQAYQDDRGRIESAYKELVASLPGSPRQLSLNDAGKDTPPEVRPEPRSRPAQRGDMDRDPEPETDPIEPREDPPRARRGGLARASGGWVPSSSETPRSTRDEETMPDGNP